MGERDNHQILMRMWRMSRSLDGDGRVQPPLPGVELCDPLGGGRRARSGHALGGVHVRGDRGDVRSHRRKEPPPRHEHGPVVRSGRCSQAAYARASGSGQPGHGGI